MFGGGCCGGVKKRPRFTGAFIVLSCFEISADCFLTEFTSSATLDTLKIHFDGHPMLTNYDILPINGYNRRKKESNELAYSS